MVDSWAEYEGRLDFMEKGEGGMILFSVPGCFSSFICQDLTEGHKLA